MGGLRYAQTCSGKPVQRGLLNWLFCVLQALAQYLVNLNVWTHNVLTVLARSRAKRTSSACDVRHAGMLLYSL